MEPLFTTEESEMKTFYTQSGQTRTGKYIVRCHDNESFYKDGSKLFHPKFFSNKKNEVKFIKELQNQGYTWRQWD